MSQAIPITCGIIGFGKMGQIRAEALKASGRATIVGIFDAALPSETPYRIYESAEALIADPHIDSVFICTPNFLIQPLIIRALRAGKHVFSEKPPAFNAAQVAEIIDVEKVSPGQKLMYGFNHRHHRSIIKMKELISGDEMGKVLWMRGRYGKEVDESFLAGWRANKELSGGGILLDQGIHMLDLFLHLAGSFDDVHAFVSNHYWKIDGIEDNVFAILRNNETGVCASLHSTMTQWRYIFSLEVFLERGSLVLNGLKTSSGAYGEEALAIKYNHDHSNAKFFQSEENLVFHTDDSWDSEIAHFLSAIEQDAPVEFGNTAQALELMTIIDKVYQNQ